MAIASTNSEQSRARIAAARAKVSKAKKGGGGLLSEGLWPEVLHTLEGPLGPETGVEHEINEAGKVLGSPIEALEEPVKAGKAAAKATKTAAKAAETAAKASETLEEFLGKLGSVETWIRIGKVLAGALLILFGLYLFAKAVSPAAVSAPAKIVKGIR